MRETMSIHDPPERPTACVIMSSSFTFSTPPDVSDVGSVVLRASNNAQHDDMARQPPPLRHSPTRGKWRESSCGPRISRSVLCVRCRRTLMAASSSPFHFGGVWLIQKDYLRFFTACMWEITFAFFQKSAAHCKFIRRFTCTGTTEWTHKSFEKIFSSCWISSSSSSSACSCSRHCRFC